MEFTKYPPPGMIVALKVDIVDEDNALVFILVQYSKILL